MKELAQYGVIIYFENWEKNLIVPQSTVRSCQCLLKRELCLTVWSHQSLCW